MKLSDLRERDINFLIELLEKKRVTKRDQRSYPNSFAFYLATWSLKDMGLIKQDGIDNKRRIIWTLTEKGERIAKILKQLVEEMSKNG